MTDLTNFIRGIPKAELHVHIEGTLEPRMLFDLAARNGVALRWRSPEALRNAYAFDDLQSFLDLYYEGCGVFARGQDFYDVTRAYLRRAHEENVVRAEMALGPQSFTERGIALGAIMDGVLGAIDDARKDCGISAGFIVSTHRHRSEADAFALLESVMPWRERIVAIGMGGPEVAHPPAKFARYFTECRRRGFRTCIHAGEEGPAGYVRQAVDLLGVDRIDHGNACLADEDLVATLAARQIALTICPVSNVKLKVVDSLDRHPLRRLLAAGLKVSINSDDPSYFQAYVTDNYLQCQSALGLVRDEIVTLARNSLSSVFVSRSESDAYERMLERYCCGVATH